MSNKTEAAYHGMDEEFMCEVCGDTYLSPISAGLCEIRDEAEAKAARKPPKVKGPAAYIRSID